VDLRPHKVSKQLNYGAGKGRFDQKIKFLLEGEALFVMYLFCYTSGWLIGDIISFQPISFSALIRLCRLFDLHCHVYKGVPLLLPIPLLRDKVQNIEFSISLNALPANVENMVSSE
jgi:hypothetical protein